MAISVLIIIFAAVLRLKRYIDLFNGIFNLKDLLYEEKNKV